MTGPLRSTVFLLLVALVKLMSNPSWAHLLPGTVIPSAVVDIVESDGKEYAFREGVDFGELLKSHKRAIVFGVPGAFTPTCSSKHLPGFVEKAEELAREGVDAIYCLSVNDKFVMRAWGYSIDKAVEATNIKLVADGNGDFTRAMELVNDRSAGRMGIRCQRFAAIVEEGRIVSIEVDEKALDKSSAESILARIPLTCSSSS